MKLLVALLILSFSTLAQKPYTSAARGHNESFREALNRSMNNLPNSLSSRASSAQKTVLKSAVPYSTLDFQSIPELSKAAYLIQGMNLFENIRDRRNLATSTAFPRRLSWLYPQDGCFMRAEIMKDTYIEKKFAVKKAFIFGELNVTTPFSSNGSVSWWFHVAPIFRVGKNVFISDPALSPFKPISLKKWALLQTKDIKNIKIALCHEDAYFPSDSCLSPEKFNRDELASHAKYYLQNETNNLQKLGYGLKKELGNHPYWRRLDGLMIPNRIKQVLSYLKRRKLLK